MPEKRENVWKNINLNTNKIEKSFKDMVKERNKFARDKGFLSRIDMALDWFKIPENDYKNFTNNIDKIIHLCNLQLPKFDKLPPSFYSEFNIPCFICQIFKFPLKTTDEAFNYIVKGNKVLNKFKYKINIKSGSESKTIYKKELDDFEITINKSVNPRHQITDLIHELSHMVSYLESFKKGIDMSDKGVYLREKQALKIEIEILRSLSTDLYKAVLFGETLALIFRTLFEIEIYKNPNQNLEKLYAKIFNKCYKTANQKTNPMFFLDERIIFSPFSSLPYAVVNVNMLLSAR